MVKDAFLNSFVWLSELYEAILLHLHQIPSQAFMLRPRGDYQCSASNFFVQSTVSLRFITQLKRYQFDFRIHLKLITSVVFHFTLRFFYRPSFDQNNDNYVHSLILYVGLHTVFFFCLRRKGGGDGGWS